MAEYQLKHANKRMYDVTLEKVQNITKQFLVEKTSYALVRDNGRFIIAFKTKEVMDNVTLHLSENGLFGTYWYKQKEKNFKFSDEGTEYHVYVCEFKDADRMEQEMYDEAERAYNHHHGIKEDGGRYSIHDVYSPSELGIDIKY